MPRRQTGEWIGTIEQHGRKFRFEVVLADGSRTKASFDSLEEAERERRSAIKAREKTEREANALTWREVVTKYMAHQRDRARAEERSLVVTEQRLFRFFRPVIDDPARLTRAGAEDLYKDLRTRPGARGVPLSVQEHHHTLSRAKALCRWLMKERILKDNPMADVEAVGRPKRGEESKRQLNRDNLWRLWMTALDHGERGDAGAAATLCASLLGMRATSIVDRRREHLDAGGRVLRVTSKGKSVELSLMGQTPEQEQVMARLRKVLALQARGKLPGAPLIGTGHDRWWVRREVRRLCLLAEVPVVPPHGLRGTHASVGRELGISPALLAGALAHSEAVQERHYATASSQVAGQQARVLGGVYHPPITPQAMK